MMRRTLELLKYDLQFISWQNHLGRFAVFSIPALLVVWSGSDVARSLACSVVLVFLGLENVYTNIFYRVPNEMDAFAVLPLSVRQLILAKNIAAVIITLPTLLVVGIIILYFALSAPSLDQLCHTMLYVVTSIFLLLHCGNRLSLWYPRREVRLDFDVLTHLVFQLMAVAVSSIPYIILHGVFGSDVLCLAFAVGSGIWWYFFSVPWAAKMFAEKRYHILEIA
jgi:hypothetical protein